MILEAFSEVLKDTYPIGGKAAHAILEDWVLGILAQKIPSNNVERVVQHELAVLVSADERTIIARSRSGQKLLNSLEHYCESFDHWMFRRWLHEAKANHFG